MGRKNAGAVTACADFTGWRVRGPIGAALLTVLAVAGTPLPVAQARPAAGRTVVRIGVVLDAALERGGGQIGSAVNTRALDLVVRELELLTAEDFDVRFPAEKTIEARWSPAAIREGIERLLADPEVDLVLTMGALGTHIACHMGDLPKPLVAPVAVESQVQRLPRRGAGSGVRNLNYLTIPTNFVDDMEVFRRLVGFHRVHVVHDAVVAEVIEDLHERVIDMARSMGFEAVPVPVGASADEALASLPPGTEAVYLVPLSRMTPQEFQRVIDGLTERKIPSFTLMGTEDVESGVLATSSPGANLERLARRVALNIHRILLGEEPGEVPVELEGTRRLAINMATARRIGWYPDFRVMLEADLINKVEPQEGRRLTLSEAVREAVAANLTLEASELSVEAARENVRTRRSALLPQLDLSASAVVLDEDRAAASLGSRPERSVSGSIGLSQVLWSDGAHAGLEIEQRLQASREDDLLALRLDTALLASTAFLELLRATTVAHIEESNLHLTESNLQLARRRQAVGVTGPAEVYRWESQVATSKARVLQAHVARLSVRTTLNRILHRPLEEEVRPESPTLESRDLLGTDSRLHGYVSNERSFRIFREFIVNEGLVRTPEVAALDEAIEAEERALLAAKRSYWSPDLLLSGELARRFSESGEGTEGPSLPPPFSSGLFPEADDTDWSIAVGLGLPLFTSGARPAEVARSSASLARLRTEREAAAERAEERIRRAVFATAASWPNIDLSAESAEASRKNLDLVTEMYGQGVVSIIDLLDAQNATLVSEEAAANAVFDFLIDLMEIQRAASSFEFFVSAAEREAWFGRLDAFAAAWQEEGGS